MPKRVEDLTDNELTLLVFKAREMQAETAKQEQALAVRIANEAVVRTHLGDVIDDATLKQALGDRGAG